MLSTSTLPDFAPLRAIDGYLPIEDYGLIGDGRTAALVGRDGSVAWLCVPRFDALPLFCSILDRKHGGALRVTPHGLETARQYYVPDTGVLVTEMRTPGGVVRVTDALTFTAGADLHAGMRAARGELLRIIEMLDGTVTLRVEIAPRGEAHAERRGEHLLVRCASLPDLDLQCEANFPLAGLTATLDLRAGERRHLMLRWGDVARAAPARDPDALLHSTCAAWRGWMRRFHYTGPQPALVRRSALTLKLLDHFENGAAVAAPTSSLPEAIGGPRNWDYRYAWVRDAAFSVYALGGIGMNDEALSFLQWILGDVRREEGERPHVLYTLDGGQPPPEREDPGLEGYRGSGPVRWGNAAADQRQHDVFGEVLDCAYQWVSRGGQISEPLWERLRVFVNAAAREWRTPDQGIWEVRTSGRTFTYSAALCHVALDRGARLAERLGVRSEANVWRAEADTIRAAILTDAWDESRNAITEHLGGGGLDASLLTLPLRKVIDARHPRMVATTEAVARELDAGQGLLYRYHPQTSPDGLSGGEGAFLLCSYWLVDNLAAQDRVDEAMDLYASLCGRANPLGLLAEQIDPGSGAFLGNYPQAFSHVGVISSGLNLMRAVARKEAGTRF